MAEGTGAGSATSGFEEGGGGAGDRLSAPVVGLVGDSPSTPAAAVTSAGPDASPGGASPSSQAAATAEDLLACVDQPGAIITDGKPPTLDDTLFGRPPESASLSSGHAGNAGESESAAPTSPPSFAAADLSLPPLGTGGRAPPLPVDTAADGTMPIPKTPPTTAAAAAASMDHIRKAALAAVSHSAKEDARVAVAGSGSGGNVGLPSTTASRRLPSGAFAASERSSSPPPSSPPSSSSDSLPPTPPQGHPPPGSPNQRPDAGEAAGAPEDSAGGVQRTERAPAPPTGAEAEPSPPRPAGSASSSSQTSGVVCDAGEETPGGTARQPRAESELSPPGASETTEHDSDSSFSAEDGGATETIVSEKPQPDAEDCKQRVMTHAYT